MARPANSMAGSWPNCRCETPHAGQPARAACRGVGAERSPSVVGRRPLAHPDSHRQRPVGLRPGPDARHGRASIRDATRAGRGAPERLLDRTPDTGDLGRDGTPPPPGLRKSTPRQTRRPTEKDRTRPSPRWVALRRLRPARTVKQRATAGSTSSGSQRTNRHGPTEPPGEGPGPDSKPTEPRVLHRCARQPTPADPPVSRPKITAP